MGEIIDFFYKLNARDWVAIWGAVLSTILACAKFFEMWRDRFRVEVDGRWTGSEWVGHEIRIRNLSKHPIIISYWNVQLQRYRFSFFESTEIQSAEHDDPDIRIESNSSSVLTFHDSRYFPVNERFLRGRNVVLLLYIAGRRTPKRFIFRF